MTCVNSALVTVIKHLFILDVTKVLDESLMSREIKSLHTSHCAQTSKLNLKYQTNCNTI